MRGAVTLTFADWFELRRRMIFVVYGGSLDATHDACAPDDEASIRIGPLLASNSR